MSKLSVFNLEGFGLTFAGGDATFVKVGVEGLDRLKPSFGIAWTGSVLLRVTDSSLLPEINAKVRPLSGLLIGDVHFLGEAEVAICSGGEVGP